MPILKKWCLVLAFFIPCLNASLVAGSAIASNYPHIINGIVDLVVDDHYEIQRIQIIPLKLVHQGKGCEDIRQQVIEQQPIVIYNSSNPIFQICGRNLNKESDGIGFKESQGSFAFSPLTLYGQVIKDSKSGLVMVVSQITYSLSSDNLLQYLKTHMKSVNKNNIFSYDYQKNLGIGAIFGTISKNSNDVNMLWQFGSDGIPVASNAAASGNFHFKGNFITIFNKSLSQVEGNGYPYAKQLHGLLNFNDSLLNTDILFPIPMRRPNSDYGYIIGQVTGFDVGETVSHRPCVIMKVQGDVIVDDYLQIGSFKHEGKYEIAPMAKVKVIVEMITSQAKANQKAIDALVKTTEQGE